MLKVYFQVQRVEVSIYCSINEPCAARRRVNAYLKCTRVELVVFVYYELESSVAQRLAQGLFTSVLVVDDNAPKDIRLRSLAFWLDGPLLNQLMEAAQTYDTKTALVIPSRKPLH